MNCLALLESGIDSWNQWRASHPNEPCDLTGADLSEGYFFEGNFQGAVLTGAKLRRACLIGADFRGADLSEADLSGAYLGDATLYGANLSNANLREANLNKADLRQTNLLKSQISEASTYRAQLPNFDKTAAQPILAASTLATLAQPIQLEPSLKATKAALKALNSEPQSGPQSEPQSKSQSEPQPDLQSEPQSKKRSAWRPMIAAGLAIAVGIPLALYGTSFNISNRQATRPAAQFALAQSLNSDTPIWAVATYTQANRDAVVVSGGANGYIDIWNKQTGELVYTLDGHEDTVRSLAISSSGQRLISSSGDGIKVWQPETGELIYSIPTEQIDPIGSPVWSVAISPDEETFISSNYDGTITLWQLETGEPIYSVFVDSTVWSVAIAPDGKSFVGGSSDRSIRQWDMATGELLQTFSGHEDAVRSVAISPDGQTLASGSWDKTIKIWDLATGELQTTLSSHADRIVSLAISADGQTLASGSIDNTLKLWDLPSRKLVTTLNNSNWILSVAFAPNQTTGQTTGQADQTANQTLVSGGKDQTVKVWH
jgi:WD40 repeat protein